MALGFWACWPREARKKVLLCESLSHSRHSFSFSPATPRGRFLVKDVSQWGLSWRFFGMTCMHRRVGVSLVSFPPIPFMAECTSTLANDPFASSELPMLEVSANLRRECRIGRYVDIDCSACTACMSSTRAPSTRSYDPASHVLHRHEPANPSSFVPCPLRWYLCGHLNKASPSSPHLRSTSDGAPSQPSNDMIVFSHGNENADSLKRHLLEVFPNCWDSAMATDLAGRGIAARPPAAQSARVEWFSPIPYLDPDLPLQPTGLVSSPFLRFIFNISRHLLTH